MGIAPDVGFGGSNAAMDADQPSQQATLAQTPSPAQPQPATQTGGISVDVGQAPCAAVPVAQVPAPMVLQAAAPLPAAIENPTAVTELQRAASAPQPPGPMHLVMNPAAAMQAQLAAAAAAAAAAAPAWLTAFPPAAPYFAYAAFAAAAQQQQQPQAMHLGLPAMLAPMQPPMAAPAAAPAPSPVVAVPVPVPPHATTHATPLPAPTVPAAMPVASSAVQPPTQQVPQPQPQPQPQAHAPQPQAVAPPSLEEPAPSPSPAPTPAPTPAPPLEPANAPALAPAPPVPAPLGAPYPGLGSASPLMLMGDADDSLLAYAHHADIAGSVFSFVGVGGSGAELCGGAAADAVLLPPASASQEDVWAAARPPPALPQLPEVKMEACGGGGDASASLALLPAALAAVPAAAKAEHSMDVDGGAGAAAASVAPSACAGAGAVDASSPPVDVACDTCSAPYIRRPGMPSGFFAHRTRAFTCHGCCTRNRRQHGFYGPPGAHFLWLLAGADTVRMLLRGSTVRDGMRGHSRRLHPSIWLLGLTRSSENLGLLLMPHAGTTFCTAFPDGRINLVHALGALASRWSAWRRGRAAGNHRTCCTGENNAGTWHGGMGAWGHAIRQCRRVAAEQGWSCSVGLSRVVPSLRGSVGAAVFGAHVAMTAAAGGAAQLSAAGPVPALAGAAPGRPCSATAARGAVVLHVAEVAAPRLSRLSRPRPRQERGNHVVARFYGPLGTRSLEEAGGRQCTDCGATGTQTDWRKMPGRLGTYGCLQCYCRRLKQASIKGRRESKGAEATAQATADAGAGASLGGAAAGGKAGAGREAKASGREARAGVKANAVQGMQPPAKRARLSAAGAAAKAAAQALPSAVAVLAADGAAPAIAADAAGSDGAARRPASAAGARAAARGRQVQSQTLDPGAGPAAGSTSREASSVGSELASDGSLAAGAGSDAERPQAGPAQGRTLTGGGPKAKEHISTAAATQNAERAPGTAEYTCDRCCRRNLSSHSFYGPPGTRSLKEAGGRECAQCGGTAQPAGAKWRGMPGRLGTYACQRCYKGAKVAAAMAADGDRASMPAGAMEAGGRACSECGTDRPPGPPGKQWRMHLTQLGLYMCIACRNQAERRARVPGGKPGGTSAPARVPPAGAPAAPAPLPAPLPVPLTAGPQAARAAAGAVKSALMRMRAPQAQAVPQLLWDRAWLPLSWWRCQDRGRTRVLEPSARATRAATVPSSPALTQQALGHLGPLDAVGKNVVRALLASGGGLPLEDASPGWPRDDDRPPQSTDPSPIDVFLYFIPSALSVLMARRSSATAAVAVLAMTILCLMGAAQARKTAAVFRSSTGRMLLGNTVICPAQPSSDCSAFYSSCASITCTNLVVTIDVTGSGCKGGSYSWGACLKWGLGDTRCGLMTSCAGTNKGDYCDGFTKVSFAIDQSDTKVGIQIHDGTFTTGTNNCTTTNPLGTAAAGLAPTSARPATVRSPGVGAALAAAAGHVNGDHKGNGRARLPGNPSDCIALPPRDGGVGLLPVLEHARARNAAFHRLSRPTSVSALASATPEASQQRLQAPQSLP
eukprot:XP_001694570.1 predicted protein [Chlamydomonas reinhardtii]